MRYLSVCSGIEAASVAWQPLGWQCAGVAEIEPFPSAVIKQHYPDVHNYGDITKFKEWPDPGPIDVLVGGTPCQSFSVAGLRKGLDDPRGNLTLTFLGLVERFAPRWILWENVPGVLSIDEGRPFGSFLGGLAQLGYGFAYTILDAQYFGLAQRRKRVFVVGHIGGQWQRAAAVLFDSTSLCGNPPPRREPRQRTAYDTSPCLGASGRGVRTTGETRGQDCVIPIDQSNPYYTSDSISPTLRAGGNQTGGDRPPGTDVDTSESLIPVLADCLQERDSKGSDNSTKNGHLLPVIARAVAAERDGYNDGSDQTYIPVASALRSCASSETGGPTRAGDKDENLVAFQPRIARNGRGDMGETVNALQAQSGQTGKGDAAPCVAFQPRFYSRDNKPGGGPETELCHALTHSPKAGDTSPHVAQGYAVRRLTPRECERLQGFPDDYTAIPWRDRPAGQCPDGPRYKALGNSFATPVICWIGQRIALVDSL